MKKIFLGLSILFIFTLSGCIMPDLKSEYEDPGIEKLTIKTKTNGRVFLVKLNTSDEIITSEKTGWVSRSADSDSFSLNNTDYIRRENKRIYDGLKTLDSDRAAANPYGSKSSGIDTSSFKKGDTEYFWSITDQKERKNAKGEVIETLPVTKSVAAICKYAGSHCYIFADVSDNNTGEKGIKLEDTDYQTLGQKFDEIYDLETAVIGNPVYEEYRAGAFPQCHDKIVIFVSDLYGDAAAGQDSGIVGYFKPADLLTKSFLDTYYNIDEQKQKLSESSDYYIHSNLREMFYVDSLFLTEKKNIVYSTLVHEFNHMINFVIKTINYTTKNSRMVMCDTWFTEMLSMTTEDMFQKFLKIEDEDSPKARLPYFNKYYNYGFMLWDNDDIPFAINYANTYAFGAFLARNFGGVELIKEIALNEYINEEAITQALKKCNPEIEDIDFVYALRKFSMCLFNTKAADEEDLKKTGDDQYFTFNRPAGKESDRLYFTAIDIMNIEVEEGGKKSTIKPNIYYSDKSGQSGLGPCGFTVHLVAYNNCPSFTLHYTKTLKKSLEFYLITFPD